MTKNPYIPDDWQFLELDEAADIILGQSPSSDTYNTEEAGLPFYQGKTEFGELYPSPVKWCSAPKKIAQDGDILISVRAPVGPTNLCLETSCIGRGLAAIRPKEGVNKKYVLYYLRYIEDEWDKKSTGTTFKAITGKVLRSQEIPIPPIPEQNKIVSKIEELFSQLDAGVARLKRAKAELERYRASVLKAAFEGRLVPQDPNDEPIDDLLISIGRTTTINPEFPNTPQSWCWVFMKDIGEEDKNAIVDGPFGSMLKKSEYVENGTIPVLTISNIDDGYEKENLRFITEEKFETIRRSAVKPGDIVMAKIGSSYGKVGFYPDEKPVSIIPANMLKITVHKALNKDFIFYYLKSMLFKNELDQIVKSTAQPAFNLTNFRKLLIVLPPLNEQKRIVCKLEENLSKIENMEVSIGHALDLSIQVRQSILKKAFIGKLS